MRFPEFSGEWERFRNCTLFKVISEKNKNYEFSTVLSASQTEGMVLRDSLGIDIKFEEDSIKTYKIVRNGDYVAHLRSFQGGFAFSDKTGVCSPAYTILRPSETISYGFLKPYFMSRKFIDSLRIVTYGIRDGKSISVEEWLKLYTCIPKANEQEKISKFLKLINERIETQKKVIEDFKKLKDAISKSLFSRHDLLETKVQISQIGSLKNGYAFQSSSYDSSGEYEIITIANVSGERNIYTEECNRIHTLPSDLQSHQELKDGDILISMTGNVGRVSLCKEGKYLLNQRVGLLQLQAGVNREFVYQALSSRQFELSMISCGQGAAQMNIGKGDIENFAIPYSSNPQNLQHISLILKSYDTLVLTENMRLQLLLGQKQYILSNMFI